MIIANIPHRPWRRKIRKTCLTCWMSTTTTQFLEIQISTNLSVWNLILQIQVMIQKTNRYATALSLVRTVLISDYFLAKEEAQAYEEN